MHLQKNIRPKGREVVDKYEAHAQTPHGRLRHELLKRYYSLFVENHKINWIFDVGGGSGMLLAALLKEHEELTAVLIDDDDAMLARAQERLGEHLEGKRAYIHKGTDQDLPAILPAYRVRQDALLVSFNHAIEYVPDQLLSIRTLTACMPGGSYFGIMYLNNSHEALRKLFHKDSIEGVLRQLTSFDLDMIQFGMARALDSSALDTFFQEKGKTLDSQFGMRCIADLKSNDFVGKNYEDMLKLEYHLGLLPDFMSLARYRLKFFKM